MDLTWRMEPIQWWLLHTLERIRMEMRVSPIQSHSPCHRILVMLPPGLAWQAFGVMSHRHEETHNDKGNVGEGIDW